ncbi:unnamed protein product [Withania somnifera]
MANSSISSKSIMVVAYLMMIFLFFHFTTLEARILGDIGDVKNKYDSHFVLNKAGFSLTEIELYTRRSLIKGSSDRVAPGGPDPQHHSLPPAN